MKNLLYQLQERFEQDKEKMKKSFQSAIEAISSIFYNYSIKDIASLIFISNIWLPNIASPVKHQFLTAIFATLTPKHFSSKNKIKTYDDFRALLKKVNEFIPYFPSLEDFIPEPDWGDVKFHHNGRNYKIFYGNELSNVYEYLTLFQMLYMPYDDKYRQHALRSPKIELEYCLSLQENIINGISTQPESDKLDISPGNCEIPPESFWENAKLFYWKFKPERYTTNGFLDSYTINLGQYPKESLSFDVFGEKVFAGSLVDAFFIKHKSRYFPVLPRRYSAILFDKWSQIFDEYHDKVESDLDTYQIRLGAQLYKYVNSRVSASNVFPLASAITKKGKPHSVVFPTVFITKNKLVMLYLTQPTTSSTMTEEELKSLTSKFKKALKLASSQPTTLALHLDRQNVQFRHEIKKNILRPELIVLVPQVSTNIKPFSVPKFLPGRVMFLDSFLGIIDELESNEMFSDFLEYLNEIEGRTQSLLSPLDKFGSFKDTYGILIGGAIEPDYISLDPHWGTGFRYKSLSEFWKIYPCVNFFDHPRAWKVKRETPTRTRLQSRGYFGFAIHCRIDQIDIFMTAPFSRMKYQQGNLSNLMMECLEDSLSQRQSIFKSHSYFRNFNRFHVNFFPITVVANNEIFHHLHHLCNIETYWKSDIISPAHGEYTIRVVFDDNAISRAFDGAVDCSLEVDILIETIKQLDTVCHDSNLDKIIQDLEKTKSGKPRFKIFAVRKEVSFPEFVKAAEPEPYHFKKAKKRIAELAKQNNVAKGSYVLEEAKQVINILRDAVVSEINTNVLNYDFRDTIPFLLTRIDALNADYERHRHLVEHGMQHDIDYQPHEKYAEKHSDYLKNHKNYRYLIEKYVQLEPNGKKKFDKEIFQYLIALIDWLHVLYSASDNIHYGIMTAGMKIDSEYLIEVIYDDDMQLKEDMFSNEMAKLDLGLIGNPADRVSSPRPIEEYLKELDNAAVKDLGFGFISMISILHILSLWPVYLKGTEEKTSYSATFDEIQNVCLINLKDISLMEIKQTLDFLTLKRRDVIRIVGQEEPCLDLPVWEYRKRCGRYSIKPLIQIGERFYWGPYSTKRTGGVWSGMLSNAMLPVELRAPTIHKVQRAEKKLVEDALVDKCFEIMIRFTPYVKKNLKLYNLNPKGIHPSSLGDYDILSYYSEKNIMFNIECKDILPPFCLKDAKRLREKIFGIPLKSEGQFRQINKRKDYLITHAFDIAEDLKWPLDANDRPEILTIYISRRSYWWTSFPPKGIEASFVRIDMLSEFMQNIIKGEGGTGQAKR